MQIVSSLFFLVVAFFVILAIFLIIRELVLWYWKVNNALGLLEWQKNLLEKNRDQNNRIIYLLEKLAGEEHQEAVLSPKEDDLAAVIIKHDPITTTETAQTGGADSAKAVAFDEGNKFKFKKKHLLIGAVALLLTACACGGYFAYTKGYIYIRQTSLDFNSMSVKEIESLAESASYAKLICLDDPNLRDIDRSKAAAWLEKEHADSHNEKYKALSSKYDEMISRRGDSEKPNPTNCAEDVPIYKDFARHLRDYQ